MVQRCLRIFVCLAICAVNTLTVSAFTIPIGAAQSVRVYLNPHTGRFWTMDTFRGNNEDPLSLHKYLYCQNNPINHADPSGHDIGEMLSIVEISGMLNALPGISLSRVSDGAAALPWLELTIDVVRVYADRYGLDRDNMPRDLARGNEIYQQAHVRLKKGDEKDIDVIEAIHLIGGDLLLNVMATGSPATSEENALTAGQRKDRFTAYYVGGFEGLRDVAGRAAYPAFYLAYWAPDLTFSHELGHNLMRNENHHRGDGPDNLMYAPLLPSDDENTGKGLLTTSQIQILRASVMAMKSSP
jgi:hypothetical protein